MADLIDRKALADEVASLRVTVTGLRAGKGVLQTAMKEYQETVLRIIEEQPAAPAESVIRCRDYKTSPATYHEDSPAVTPGLLEDYCP